MINALIRKVPVKFVYVAGLLPAGVLAYRLFAGELGVDVARVLEHRLGEIALQFFIATMAISPLLKMTSINLVRFRRALGVLVFLYAGLHLLVWLVFDMQFNWPQIWSDITRRPYIMVGMAAFLLCLPLAATSNNQSIRRLGGRMWKRLHKLAYPALLLAGLHMIMVQKVWDTESLVYIGLILGVLGLRFRFYWA